MSARWLFIAVFFTSLCLFFSSPAQALAISTDPQYVVMNFSTINELNWAAPEDEWQTQIKPQVLKELDAMLAVLPKGSSERKLAWSTLMEYMNFPMDEPSPQSPYVIKVRRIFEIAEERDLPVFVPLNGFQWWDELPELYNWWDPDGTKTDPRFFARQDNPEDFKRRFIAGYNPENKWNVEWQTWNQPMQLNWRNWGGGGFRLAPPPNLVKHQHPATQTYREVVEARLNAILKQVKISSDALDQKGKSELFAGISLGTEISLNASATSKDEFMPYGYRSMSDTICDKKRDDQGECLKTATGSADLQQLRSQIVGQYLLDLSRVAHKIGIPKERVYTHVWGEAPPSDPKFAPYASSAFNLYSRPGLSLYGFAEKPYDSSSWRAAQTRWQNQPWGAVEYSVPKEPAQANRALANTLNSVSPDQPPATVTVIYNWSEHKNTPAIPALKKALAEAIPYPTCAVPQVITNRPEEILHDPTTLTWNFVESEIATTADTALLTILKGLGNNLEPEVVTSIPVESNTITVSDLQLQPGVYTWYVEVQGCNLVQSRTSQPQTITIPHSTETKNTWIMENILSLF